MKIDLDSLERIARAAAQEESRNGWHLVASDGSLIGSAVFKHVEANDPDTTISLVKRIRDLEKIATRALGEWRAWHAEVDTSNAEAWKATEAEIEAMIKQVEDGPVRYPDAYPEPPAPPPHTIGS